MPSISYSKAMISDSTVMNNNTTVPTNSNLNGNVSLNAITGNTKMVARKSGHSPQPSNHGVQNLIQENHKLQ